MRMSSHPGTRTPTTQEAQRMSSLIKRSPPAQKTHLIEQAIKETLGCHRDRSHSST